MSTAQITMNSLRKLITKFLAKILELRKENTEIPELREKLIKFAEVEAKKMELRRKLKARTDELEKIIANSSAKIGKLNVIIVDLEKYKSAISKLEFENAEFRVRFMKLEQDHEQIQ